MLIDEIIWGNINELTILDEQQITEKVNILNIMGVIFNTNETLISILKFIR